MKLGHVDWFTTPTLAREYRFCTPPKGTSTALHLPWVKIWRPNSKRFLSCAANKIWMKNKKKKKVVYMGRSEVGGGETCFSLKTWASASLAYSTFAFPTSNQAMELKKKTDKNFFLKNFWFLKFFEKKIRNFFNFFSKKLESLNHWLECIKIWESYSSNSSRYGRCENCTKNDVFCPKMS